MPANMKKAGIKYKKGGSKKAKRSHVVPLMKSGGPVFNKKGIRVPGMFQDGGTNVNTKAGSEEWRRKMLEDAMQNRAGIDFSKDSDEWKNIDTVDPNAPPTPPLDPKEQFLLDNEKYRPIDPTQEKIIPGNDADAWRQQQEILKSKRSNPFSGYKKGGQKRKTGGAVFNRNGTRVPGMRKGR